MAEFEPTRQPRPARTLSWSEAWINAVIRPSEDTFAEIAHDPNATTQRAYNWVAVAALISYLIQIGLVLLLSGGLRFQFNIGGLLCGVPVTIVLAAIFFTILVGLSHLIARALGGVGEFAQLANAVAAYTTPIGIVTTALIFIPALGQCLSLLLGLYAIVLNIIAIKAVHEFGWGEAIVSSVVIWVGLLICVAVVVIVILALLGPAIGNVFSNVLQGLNP